jgi:hypothetical protein
LHIPLYVVTGSASADDASASIAHAAKIASSRACRLNAELALEIDVSVPFMSLVRFVVDPRPATRGRLIHDGARRAPAQAERSFQASACSTPSEALNQA